VDEMPLIAAIDADGGNLYETGPRENTFVIRPTRAQEAGQVMELYRQTLLWMRTVGLGQWDENYPNSQGLHWDMEHGNAFVAVLGGRIVGAMTLDDTVEEQYDAIDWQVRGPIQSIHRLCVHPDAQGGGYAARMVRFAEALAIQRGAAAIRLDTCSDNLRARQLYLNAGYVQRGTCVFPSRPELTFICMEKKL
ncbi:MAG: GNAT family N-acetyltransferase, partial [Eubacteriales bacterium]|nr:GNAT family N-acetyltransferase [Eubacteriales bacterium]